MPKNRPNWKWEDLANKLQKWGHDPELDRALAGIADTPVDVLPGRSYRPDTDGTPIAAVRYVDDGPWRIVFMVLLRTDGNVLVLLDIYRRPW